MKTNVISVISVRIQSVFIPTGSSSEGGCSHVALVVAAEARQLARKPAWPWLRQLASSSMRLRGRGWSTAVAAQQWKKRRGEEEEEEDDRWGPRVSERERGGPNCGSGAPDVQNKIFSLLNWLQPVRGVLCPNSPKQSIFWQTAQNGVSASKRPSLWMSARQLSLVYSINI